MPVLIIVETGANGQAHDYVDVSAPLAQLKTWANTTKLDYLNLQDNGARPSNTRSHAGVVSGRIKVRNDSGGTLTAGTLAYYSGTHSDTVDNYPTVAKAISTQANSTTKYAVGVIETAIANNADGTIAESLEVSGLDTSAINVGDRVWLADTAGAYENNLSDLPDIDYRSQVVGVVTVSHATLGRIVFGNWSVVPYSIANEV